MHGMTMIFLYAMPILSGFSNYLWPLLLGARDMAFPRLNALSYWIYVAAGMFMYAGFVVGVGPNDGWFNYVPYAARTYNPGLNMDFYALGMIFLGISTTVGAANFIVTFLRTARARHVDQPRADPDLGHAHGVGREHLRRAGGQPGVLPAVDGPPVRHAFLRRVGRRPAAAVAASVLDVRPSLGLRHRAAGDGHGVGRPADVLPPAAGRLHRRSRSRPSRRWCSASASGCTTCSPPACPRWRLSFFSGASIIITVPSAVAVFAWIATIWLGRPGRHDRLPVSSPA